MEERGSNTPTVVRAEWVLKSRNAVDYVRIHIAIFSIGCTLSIFTKRYVNMDATNISKRTLDFYRPI